MDDRPDVPDQQEIDAWIAERGPVDTMVWLRAAMEGHIVDMENNAREAEARIESEPEATDELRHFIKWSRHRAAEHGKILHHLSEMRDDEA